MAFSLSLPKGDLNSATNRTQKTRLSGSKGTFELPRPVATKRNEQDLSYLHAKSIQQGQERSHSFLCWSSPGTCASTGGVPISRAGHSPWMLRLPRMAPAPELLVEAAILDNNLTSFLPWPGDS